MSSNRVSLETGIDQGHGIDLGIAVSPGIQAGRRGRRWCRKIVLDHPINTEPFRGRVRPNDRG